MNLFVPVYNSYNLPLRELGFERFWASSKLVVYILLRISSSLGKQELSLTPRIRIMNSSSFYNKINLYYLLPTDGIPNSVFWLQLHAVLVVSSMWLLTDIFWDAYFSLRDSLRVPFVGTLTMPCMLPYVKTLICNRKKNQVIYY